MKKQIKIETKNRSKQKNQKGIHESGERAGCYVDPGSGFFFISNFPKKILYSYHLALSLPTSTKIQGFRISMSFLTSGHLQPSWTPSSMVVHSGWRSKFSRFLLKSHPCLFSTP